MKKTIIQLIGFQTIPNILPLLAIAPDRVVNIYTNDTVTQHERIKKWYDKFGEQYGLFITFADTPPIGDSLAETQRAVTTIIKEEIENADADTMFILNMTGGTKAMSISAILNILQLNHQKTPKYPIPIVYLNAKNNKIEFATHSELQDSVIKCALNNIKLSIESHIEACSAMEIEKQPDDWKSVYPAAKKLHQLATKGILFDVTEINESNYRKFSESPFSEFLTNNNQRELKKAQTALKKLATEAETNNELKEAFRRRGMVAKNGDFYFSNTLQKEATGSSKSNAIIYKMRERASFIVGGWWEVIVAHAYKKQHPDAEVLWSVRTAVQGDKGMETDIIASNGQALCCISCKRHVRQKGILQTLEQHHARANTLSGTKNELIVAFFNSKSIDNYSGLLKALKLQVWDGSTINAIEDARAPRPEPEQPATENSLPPQKAVDTEDSQKETPADMPRKQPFYKHILKFLQMIMKWK